MRRPLWAIRFMKALMLLLPGATVLGTSCGVETRDAAIGAGADFVGDSIGAILNALFPVEEWLTPDDAG